MSEMTSRIVVSTSDTIHTPLQEDIKSLVWILLEQRPLALDEGLQLREELLDRIQVW